jgi:hypothetical protein
MRIESSVTSLSWIPKEAVEGMPKLPFETGIAHYDDPPPERIENLHELVEADAFREANELRGWIDVDDEGGILDYGHSGGGHIGVTRLRLGRKEVSVEAVAMPTLQPEPEVGAGWVRFVQTAGGRTGAPAPRRVRGRPFVQFASALAWTTLALTVRADGSSEHEVVGASPFPRHWIYDDDGKLVEKSGVIDFKTWYREAHERNSPWGGADSPALITAVETELERELSKLVVDGGERKRRSRRLNEKETLVEQGDAGDSVFLLFDGMLGVEVDDEPLAELGPGSIVGVRAAVEGTPRTSTLRALTPCRVMEVPSHDLDPEALAQVATGHRREVTDA